MLFNVFTAFAYRKDFELKDELNWVMGHLHAGGFWDKWNSDQFIREVSQKETSTLGAWRPIVFNVLR